MLIQVSETDSVIDYTYTQNSLKTFYRGQKRYELSNHLGNVLSVITDRRIQACGAGDDIYYNAQVVSVSDYYPFGMGIKEREWSDSSFGYRFGFNGKEQDNEVAGSGNSYDYGFRIYNPRMGRFLSVDPLTSSYPWYTPYQFAGNKPIVAIDLDGLEELVVSVALNDPKYMGKMWDVIKSSEVLKSQYSSVTLASKLETHKIYSVLIPKSMDTDGLGGFTLDNDNIRGACQLVLSSIESTEATYYKELFKANNLDAKEILSETLDKNVNLVAVSQSEQELDEYAGFGTHSFIHELIAHVKNNMTGVVKTEEEEHYDFHKESDKTEEENNTHRSEFSPPTYSLGKSRSLAGDIWREIQNYMITEDSKKTPDKDPVSEKDSTATH